MKKRLLTVAGCVILVGVALGGWAYYSLAHFSIPVTPAQTEAMQIAFKGSLGEVMFGNVQPQTQAIRVGRGLDALLASTPPPQGEGLISAYQKDPAKFKKYAQLFDTAVNAKRVAQFIQANRSGYNLPLSTSALALDERLDAWGHPYCVTATRTGLAVVSGGAQSASFDCSKQNIPTKEIVAATRQIFQTTSGHVVVLVGDRDVPNGK